jgi:hypothetical protein
MRLEPQSHKRHPGKHGTARMNTLPLLLSARPRGWWVRQLILCIGLGFATTVLVTWALLCPKWANPGPVQFHGSGLHGGLVADVSQSQGKGVRLRVWGLHDCTRINPLSEAARRRAEMFGESRGSGDTRAERVAIAGPTWRLRSEAVPDAGEMVIDVAAGWPSLSLQGRTEIPRVAHAPIPYAGIAGIPAECAIGMFVWETARPAIAGAPSQHQWCFPFQPMARGLLADASLFSLPWVVLLLGLPALQVWRRCAHGHCPGCGYDLCHNAHLGCPECGWNLPPATEQSA